jgi:arylsulfatase
MVDRMDREIGRVLEQIRKMNQWENTLILFASDNGASHERTVRGDGHDPTARPGSEDSFLCLEPAWANLANTPFRKSKIFNHEGGIATPLVVHWPAGIQDKGALRHAPGHLIDVVPTALELAGVRPPAEFHGAARPPLAGVSLVPAFVADVPLKRDFLFFKHQGNRALRVGDWKIVASKDAPWELYDLALDRCESNDLADRYPEKVKVLVALWEERDSQFASQGATGGDLP